MVSQVISVQVTITSSVAFRNSPLRLIGSRRDRHIQCVGLDALVEKYRSYGRNSVQKFLGLVAATPVILVVSRTTNFDIVFVPQVDS